MFPLKYLLPLFALAAGSSAIAEIGTDGTTGPRANPKTVSRLEITKPGVYENLIVDGAGASGNLVKITADNVTVRHCEIRNGSGNGIGVFGTKVVIENCRIHHMLAGTFKDQKDAHGITGRWGDVTIRNCDISYTSGDSIQFDPDRKSSGTVVIERCELWTGPLPADAAGFKAGERPGENAMDTKTMAEGPRCVLKMRDCFVHGWNQPAQIDNVAALNLKENVDAEITHCVFDDNENALRVRGPGKRGGAHVVISDCAIYNAATGVRAEDKIEVLKISKLGFGKGVRQRISFVNGKATPGYENTGEHDAPADRLPSPKISPMKPLHLFLPLFTVLALVTARADDLRPPITQGQRVFTCGHSFHVFTYKQVDEMAKAAGIDHQLAGISSIGGSMVMRHWEVPDEKNAAKAALTAGKVDVLTLSPIWLPDEGIENFAKLAVQGNPAIRVTVQEYWLPNDEYEPVYPLQVRKGCDHDATDLAKLREANARYMKDIEEHVRGINQRLGKDALIVVPVGLAASALREKIAAGEAPGLKKQSDLFRDPWGHAQPPLQILSSYCHFAVIYRRSPVGLPVPSAFKALKDMSDDDKTKLNKLLQELAWDAVSKHPMGGVKAKG